MKKFWILVSEIYGKEIDIKAKTEEEAIKIYEKKVIVMTKYIEKYL